MTRRVEDHAGWGLKGGEAVAALSLTQFAESQGIIRPIRMTLLELEQAFLVDQRGWGNAGIERRILDAFVRLREVAEVLEAELGRRDNSFRRHRQLRLLREHALMVRPTLRLKATRTPQREKPRPTPPNQWWGIDMTTVLVEQIGWESIVLLVDWYIKKIVGHCAGLQAKPAQWLVAVDQKERYPRTQAV